MNRTARESDATSADLNETVVYQPDSSVREGRERPTTGSDAMPTPNHQANGRYNFSSGARPLDGYTIKRAIGRGGFGEVYYATSDSGKEVALKHILRNLDVERRGVVQCMNLKCPNLVTVYDLKGNDAGETFVIMEYVAGPSLANVLSQYRHGLPPAEALTWLKGLVEGVAYLHDHGIVHRDLKPANLFMEEGIVKIGDYGLAKLIAPSQAGTEHSESIGTCHYMAPELASGKYNKPIDIYAIGVILYEMLTGKVPFDGESVGEVLMKHLTSRPDVSRLAEPYRTIVARALAKDPNHRPSRVHDLLPPDLAPRPKDVRFIGDPRNGQSPNGPQANPKAGGEDVMVIGEEEPVFYIGPNTRPPREAIVQKLRANWAGVRLNRVAQRPQPQAPRVQPHKPAPAPAPPPPEPPVLPGGRVRVAELASSMLWAAPVVALLTIPAAGALGLDTSADPGKIGLLYGMGLLGTWGALVPAKLIEGRSVSKGLRRSLNLGVGAIVGLLGGLLATGLDIGSLSGPDLSGVPGSVLHLKVLGLTDPFGSAIPLAYAACFGLLSFLTGWATLAPRDRKRRLRVWPVLKAMVIAALIGTPFSESWGPAVAIVAAVSAAATLAVSPWSAPAAAYARYAARMAKLSRRKVA